MTDPINDLFNLFGFADDSLKKKIKKLKKKLHKKNESIILIYSLYEEAHAELAELKDRIEAKGGEAFLNSEPSPPVNLTKAELTALIQLCHPDKHGGKDIAVRMTQKLLELRDK